MGYLYAIINYLKTPKARHDLFDYIRAVLIISTIMALVRVTVDIVRFW